jgi:sialic acid synthase SpsE
VTTIAIGNRLIGDDYPTYTIADIAANHDGSLDRAKMLIRLAAESGADCAKFQTFSADKIVSDEGFKRLGRLSHQASWKKSVYDVYKDASMPREWIPELAATCKECGIDFASTPYDREALDLLLPYMPFVKIGSGDITWHDFLGYVAERGKPVILSTGASDIGEVDAAMRILSKCPVVLCQCQTSYTGDDAENLRHVHLRVLDTYKTMYPHAVVGLSDHTKSLAPALGAVALGARVIERHFTDDRTREGPDHHFSLEPAEWYEMVWTIRELEAALGSPRKFITDAEKQTVVMQRRGLYAARDIWEGDEITDDDVTALRPCLDDAVPASDRARIVGSKANSFIKAGQPMRRWPR